MRIRTQLLRGIATPAFAGAILALAVLPLTGCNSGGGGGGGTVPPPPVKPDPKTGPLRFTDVTKDAGLFYSHGITNIQMPAQISGGCAVGDYDNDGWVDIYVVRGTAGPNSLFRNKGDGTFEEVGKKAGVDLSGAVGSGPHFADWDGDGDLDLFVGGVLGAKPRMLLNKGNGTFEDITTTTGITTPSDTTFSAAFGDIDGDGDLDLFMTHWGDRPKFRAAPAGHMWRNNGNNTFTDITEPSGILSTLFSRDVKSEDYSFTPNFADINDDGRLDLLMCSDFGESRVYVNVGDGTFEDVTDHNVITDENGMGSTVGDYDNDGDLDWFVSSVWLPPGKPKVPGTGTTGNRLYRNDGNGVFEDVTGSSGVRVGYWGWAASFADINNDGWLDIVHTNGFGRRASNGRATDPLLDPFIDDPTRVFLNNRNGSFTEVAKQLGLDDTNQGRGLVCFDYDKDGDIDVFIANNDQPGRLFRNDGVKGNWLTVQLRGPSPNTEGIGARVHVYIGSSRQMREIRSGNNFVSQDPAEAHFGLGASTKVDRIVVEWPANATTSGNGGAQTVLQNVTANQRIVIE